MQENDQTTPFVSNKVNGHILCIMLLDERLNDVFVPVIASWELEVVPGVVFRCNLLEKRLALLVEPQW